MLQLFVLLLDQAIRRNDVNRVAIIVKVAFYSQMATRECPRRVVTTSRLVGVHLNALRHDGRGPLVL